MGAEAGAELVGKKGQDLTTDAAAKDLSADDLDVLVIAGGFGPDKLRPTRASRSWCAAMDEAGKPIAFICHAGWVPISAGIVEGRRVTSVAAIADDLRNAGAEWEDAEVVVDGNFVTSRRPPDLPAFMTRADRRRRAARRSRPRSDASRPGDARSARRRRPPAATAPAIASQTLSEPVSGRLEPPPSRWRCPCRCRTPVLEPVPEPPGTSGSPPLDSPLPSRPTAGCRLAGAAAAAARPARCRSSMIRPSMFACSEQK